MTKPSNQRLVTEAALAAALSSGGVSGSYSYTNLTNIPTSFPPSAHTHNAVDITAGTLTVAQGGTGATTAAAARTALGAAATSHTHDAADVTSGLLSIARGGTGSGTAASALTALGAAAATHTHVPSAITGGTTGQVLTVVNGAASWANPTVTTNTFTGIYNVLDATYGAKGDTKTVTDAVATAGSATVTSASAGFVSGDVGKRVVIGGTYTTIKTVNSGTSITLNATVVVSTATFSGDSTPDTPGAPLTILTYGTDDNTAINAALTDAYNAGGGTVLIPGGRTYFVTGPIQIKSYTRLQAYGATIKKALPNAILGGSQKYWDSTSTSHADNTTYSSGYPYVVVEGGTWDNMGQNATAGSNGWTFAHTHDVEVRNCVIRNIAGAHGVEFDGVQVGRVFNVAFHGYRNVPLAGTVAPGGVTRAIAESIQIDYGSYPTDTQPCDTITIDGCTFDQSGDTGLPGRAVGSHSVITGKAHKNVTVVNCHIFGTLNQGIRFLQYNNGLIANNIIENAGADGIRCDIWDSTGSSNTAGSATNRLVISSNVVVNSGAHGIAVAGGDSNTKLTQAIVVDNVVDNTVSNGIYFTYSDQCLAAGNSVTNAGAHGVYALYCNQPSFKDNQVTSTGTNGVYISYSPEGSIVGNHVTTAGAYGIIVSNSSTDSIVTSNHIHGANTNSAIAIAGTSNYCTVTSNQGRAGSSAAGWSAHSFSGLYITGSVTGTIHFGNDMYGLSSTDAGISSVTSTVDR